MFLCGYRPNLAMMSLWLMMCGRAYMAAVSFLARVTSLSARAMSWSSRFSLCRNGDPMKCRTDAGSSLTSLLSLASRRESSSAAPSYANARSVPLKQLRVSWSNRITFAMLASGSAIHAGSAVSIVPAAAASMVDTNRMHDSSALVPAYHSVPDIFPMNAVSSSRCLFDASEYASPNQKSRTSMGDLMDDWVAMDAEIRAFRGGQVSDGVL